MLFYRFVLIEHEAYQSFEKAISTTTTFIRGRGFIKNFQNDSLNFDSEFDFKNLQIFDTAEYIIPANENQALFLMTNFIKTHQTKGFCDEVSARK